MKIITTVHVPDYTLYIVKQKSQKVYDCWTELITQTRIQTMCNIKRRYFNTNYIITTPDNAKKKRKE